MRSFLDSNHKCNMISVSALIVSEEDFSEGTKQSVGMTIKELTLHHFNEDVIKQANGNNIVIFRSIGNWHADKILKCRI